METPHRLADIPHFGARFQNLYGRTARFAHAEARTIRKSDHDVSKHCGLDVELLRVYQ